MARSRPPLFVPTLPIGEDGRIRIKRLLIANRGEIACRVIATCKALNIVSIAVYTDPDAESVHVKAADEAISLGPINGTNGNPLLDIDLLVKVALDQRADAVHPGYGYLSENAKFSQKVSEAGILFVGPSPEGMSVLGDKRMAKEYIREHASSIPLVPGYSGSEQDAEQLSKEAEKIGYPVLIKASAGGGGRGMRIVYESARFSEELQRAQSEAGRSFSSSDCILEKYIERSKHIEIQIIGDSYGNVVSLFERECSVQRRHQKVIEETPSPWLDEVTRKKMSDAAVTIGKLIQYEGAGTVEFIVDVDTKEFYFLEVNTRVQVEHPITEEVTGVDIVATQLFVAAGGDLTQLSRLQNLQQNGHAIECRLCAEDPARDFMPDTGRILRWTPATDILPQQQVMDVRFEAGVATGSEVAIYFDSMIAKIVVWASTRTTAIAKMLDVMSHTVCAGLKTNQSFLQSCLKHPGFLDPEYTTNFIPDNKTMLLQNPYSSDPDMVYKLLSFIPSILFRNPDSTPYTSRRSPFQSLPRNFRNQKKDTANVRADVVELFSGSTLLIVWSDDAKSAVPSTYTVSIRPISSPQKLQEASSPQDAEKPNPSAHLARLYNKSVVGVLREPIDTEDSTTHRISFRSLKSELHVTSNKAESWRLYNLDFMIDNLSYKVYAATGPDHDSTEAGTSQTVLCHVPSLGVPLEYHRYNMLSYGEHIRARGPVAAAAAGAERSVKSPMPCKILNILVKEGQKVSKGDVIMVVESMKVELKMVAAVSGTYKGAVKEGTAVDEATLLFDIE